MLKNYFIVAVRNFWRNKVFSAINVLSLSIGISAALVIFLIVNYELSFDKFEKDRDKIYRVVLDASFSGTEGHSAGVQAPLSAAIENEVTGVEQVIPVFQFQGDGTAKVAVATINQNKQVVYKKQPNIVFTNQQYFQLLNYKWIAGTPGSAMRDPFSIVLTESRAKQYFSSLAAAGIIGKHITYNGDITATITGVMQYLNETTAFTANEFISLATIAAMGLSKSFES